VKSALALAVSAGVDAQCCNLALAYLQREDGPPCFGYYHRRDLVMNRPKATVFHCVAIQGDPEIGRLIGYVELYSIYRMVIGLSDHDTGPAVAATYAIRPTHGTELSLDVDLSFTDEDFRFALAYEDDVGPGQRKAFGEVMEIVQQISFEREQDRVARKAYSTTLSKLGLEPGQKMTSEIALEMSKEITKQMMPFLRHHISSRGRR
jgi:hypothetical protein